MAKWPAEHWRLAFQGQLRTISGRDAGVPAGGPRHERRSPADRVRTLLLRADNVLKNEGDPDDRRRRAREALEQAREVAQDASVDPRVRELVERRIAMLEG